MSGTKSKSAHAMTEHKPKLNKDTKSEPTLHAQTRHGPLTDRSPSTTTTSNSALSATPHILCHDALLVLGTYHSVMAGVVLRQRKFYLHFSVKYHVGCVHAVALCPRYLVSGGADERLFLFTNKTDVRRPTSARASANANAAAAVPRLASLGSLNPPAEVVALTFAPASHATHLICGCADGQVVVYRTRDWALAMPPLPVHTKSVLALASHPRSGGSLAVTMGADRVVAVLDLARGRLLSRWKYNAAVPVMTSNDVGSEADVNENDADDVDETDVDSINNGRRQSANKGKLGVKRVSETRATNSKKHSKKDRTGALSDSHRGSTAHSEPNPSRTQDAQTEPSNADTTSAATREQPIGLCFSPSGRCFAVFARFSFVVYHSLTLHVVCAHTLSHPQPQDELQACIFVDDDVLLLGNESGALFSYVIPSTERVAKDKRAHTTTAAAAVATTSSPPRVVGDECVSHVKVCSEMANAPAPSHVTLRYPDETNTAASMDTTQVGRRASHSSQHRHRCRIKAITRQGMTFFTVDSSGIVIAWDASVVRGSAWAKAHVCSHVAETSRHDDGAVSDVSHSQQQQQQQQEERSMLQLNYVASVNCKGRVTSMASMAL